MPERLAPSERAPGLKLGDGVALPPETVIGAHVAIHSGVTVGPGCTIQDGAIVGKRLGRDEHEDRANEPVEIGAGTIICCSAIVSEGVTIGERAIIGDQAHLREGVRIGADSLVGQGTSLSVGVEVGARVRIESQCDIGGPAIVEDDVFMGPGVTATNDNTLARLDGAEQMRGPVLRHACRVGGRVLLLPGIEIGEEAFVAAGSLVTRDVPAHTVVMGSPARVLRAVPEDDLIEHHR
jgi:acetyltransferase-like isoleucine patch superfamily enzyme